MIALEARAPALNRLRSWRLSADQDLFGQWQAVVTFGRIGRRGQVRRHAFDDEAGLSRFVRCALLRRRSATRRIGVSYEAVQASPSVLPLLAQLGVAVGAPSEVTASGARQQNTTKANDAVSSTTVPRPFVLWTLFSAGRCVPPFQTVHKNGRPSPTGTQAFWDSLPLALFV